MILVIIADNGDMTIGMTIDQIAEELTKREGKPVHWKTAHKRIETLEKQGKNFVVCRKALYDPTVLDFISNVPGKGRPRKTEPEPEKPKRGKK